MDQAEVIRIVRGGRCRDRRGLFQEFAAALQFPYYFGNNWDALSDCLRDLEWLPGASFVIVLTNVSLILQGQGKDFASLITVLGFAAEDWSNRAEAVTEETATIPFKVIFHTDSAHQAASRERLERIGIDFGISSGEPT